MRSHFFQCPYCKQVFFSLFDAQVAIIYYYFVFVCRLMYCAMTDVSCTALASVLKSPVSHLKELNLSGNKFGDVGMKQLSAGLENPHCKVEILK